MAIISIKENLETTQLPVLTLDEVDEGKHYLIVEGNFKGRILFCTYQHLKLRSATFATDGIFATDNEFGVWYESDKQRYNTVRLREVNLSITYSFVN